MKLAGDIGLMLLGLFALYKALIALMISKHFEPEIDWISARVWGAIAAAFLLAAYFDATY